MEIAIFSRDGGKRETKKLKRDGNIPAVIYLKGEKTEHVFLKKSDFKAILRSITSGHLSTMVFNLKGADKNVKAVIKEVQYDIISYEPIHIDFEILKDDTSISINVPINYIGENECSGVKLGGILRFVIRSLKVKCLPKNIPYEFSMNVQNMNIGDSKKLQDLQIPEGVFPLAKMSEVAVVVAKRT